MKFKKVEHTKASFGFITGHVVGIVVGILFIQNKAGTVKQEQMNKQTDLVKAEEIANHLAYLGHQAEQSTLD